MQIQPIFVYTMPIGGAAFNLMYMGSIVINWMASTDQVLLPLGLTASFTLVTKNGTGIDIGAGPYFNVLKPDTAPDMSVKFAVSVIFP